MASARARRTTGVASGRRALREAIGLGLIGFALLSGLALWSFDPADPAFHLVRVRNAAGPAGATLAAILRHALGDAAWVTAAIVGMLGVQVFARGGTPPLASRFWASAALLLASSAPLAASVAHLAPAVGIAGGSAGVTLWTLEATAIGAWGALVVNGLLFGVGVLGLVGVAPEVAGRAASDAGALAARAASAAGAALGRAARATWPRVRAAAQAAREAGVRGAAAFAVWRERRARRARVAAVRESEPAMAPAPVPDAAPELARFARRRGAVEPSIVDHRDEREKAPRQGALAFGSDAPRGPYRLPDATLFDAPPAGRRAWDRESLIMNSRILEKKLADFGISGRVVTVHPGPVVTMYEYEPASGVKLNRIVGLADDLALALRALSVRIIAPLPGKSVVGIEVANAEREIVTIREMLESESFRTSRSRLTVALGKDIFGNPVDTDLARMPHLLVAGATGTGKSVFLNSLLCSILFRATPDELKLLLIDPKLLELSVYEGIPHLIADVVTNPKRAAAALGGVVHKMEERYRMMQALTVRSIDQFNAKVDELRASGEKTIRLKARPGEEEGEERPLARLAYILVVIDELADLMVVSARDVEESLQRLAQMARAAGIHLVLATQRPSVDVLTGVIKANFPARISFQVSSRTDSRTILDQNGADNLLGQGDMLFLPPGTSKLQRIHGSFVSEKEVVRLVAFLREQGRPEFDETLVRLREESEAKEARGEDVDAMYDQAVQIVAETRNASISYLQRRLKVGYNRAARMIEQMELEGIVGPQDGSKPREVHARSLELE